jgi:hypothetical protein
VIDLNSHKHKLPKAARDVCDVMDAALEAQERSERDYLGASAIGEPCSRKIQYQMKQPERFPAKLYRIFERGHDGEERAIRHMKLAGFKIKTHKENGHQIGFVSGKGRYRGHVDGIILESPVEGIQTPCLWEHKEVSEKGFKAVQSRGVQKAYPKYYDQITQYQAYLDLTAPAMFMATNANTQERYVEMIPFDAKRAQEVTDKAVNILQANEANEMLPRPYADADGFGCRFCAYKEECWADA